MRRALRRAGWALAAAGGIGIAAPAGAQTQAVQLIGPGGHAEQSGEVILMTEGQARLEEGQVELGLLADPMLFSFGLGAHVQGAALELRGFVPTEEVREQALKVAREKTALHVIDRLKLAPNLATRGSIDKPENIQHAAKVLLEETIPVHGRTMDVKCDARGRVTITGSVASSEDRVLVSRKMRQVSGCSCVVNQLEVVSAGTERRPAETTGTVAIPDVPPMTTRPAVRHSEPSVPAVPARTVSLPPVPSRPAMPAVPKEIDPPTLAMPRVHPEPVAVAPVPAPMVKPLPDLPSIPRHVESPVIEITPPPVKPDSRPMVPVPSIDKERPYGSGTPGAATLTLPPPVKLPEVVNQPAAPAIKPPPLPPVVPLSPVTPLPKLPAVEKRDKGGSEESYVSEGTITLDDDPPPAKPVGSAKATTTPKAPTVPPVPASGSTTPMKMLTIPPAPSSGSTATLQVPALPPVPASDLAPTPKAPTIPAVPKSDLPPAPVKPSAGAAKAPPTPVKPAEGTMTLTPPPMPPSRPASAPVVLTAPPAKPPAPAAPPRSNVPLVVRLKERIQGVCGPAYEVKVTASGKNGLKLDITGPFAGEEMSIIRRITPVLESKEFHDVEVALDVITPVK